ncbi:hypothetical protein BC830DRAFT_255934 [Chytriomyces sp. MP71]|nr:hypothetical protein BC830DRAFT_255934 [Chytriomyces sp. MP71]
MLIQEGNCEDLFFHVCSLSFLCRDAGMSTSSDELCTSEQVHQFLQPYLFSGGAKRRGGRPPAPPTSAVFAKGVAAHANARLLVHSKDAQFACFALCVALSSLSSASFSPDDDAPLVADALGFFAVLQRSATASATTANNLAPLFARIASRAAQHPLSDHIASCVALASNIARTVARENGLKHLLRNSLEADVALMADTCAALLTVSCANASSKLASEFALFSMAIFDHTRQALSASANQKKVFQLFASKLLVPILTLRHHLATTNVSPSHQKLLASLDEILKSSLFHKEHVPEYVAALQSLVSPTTLAPASSLMDTCNNLLTKHFSFDGSAKSASSKAKISYPKQLFDALADGLKNSE